MSVRDTMTIDVSLGSLSCGDSSDFQFASASQSVLLSIAFQDFIFAHLWPHAFSGDKRTDADQATVVEWIVYDQRNEKRVCMNATSRSHLTVGWSGEGSYLSVHVFDHHVILFPIDQSTSFPYAILVTSSKDHQASNLSRPKETCPVKGWGWLRFQTGGLFWDFIFWFCQLLCWCPFVTPWRLMCLCGSLSCGDSSDFQFASASQSVLPSIAFQDFIFAHLWPHAFSGDKRTDADQATVVEWIVYDQRNEKRVCMNATSIYLFFYFTLLSTLLSSLLYSLLYSTLLYILYSTPLHSYSTPTLLHSTPLPLLYSYSTHSTPTLLLLYIFLLYSTLLLLLLLLVDGSCWNT